MTASERESRLQKDLRALYRTLNHPPSTADVKQLGQYSLRDYYSLLEPTAESQTTTPPEYISQDTKWAKVLRTAEISLENYDPYSTRYSRSELTEELIRLSIETSGTLTPSVVQSHSRISFATFTNRLGKWPNPLIEADIIPSPDAYTSDTSRKIPSDDLDEALQRLADDLGRPPYSPEMDAEGDYSARTYLNRRGTWRQALEHAGLSTHNAETNIPREDLIAELQRLYEKFGKRLSKMSLQVHSQYNPQTYQHRFRSLQEAYDEADIPPNPVAETSK